MREYALYIPDSYDGTQAYPLVVFLHGGSGNKTSAQNFTRFNEVAEANDFLMLYPQGGWEAQPGSFVWADGRGLPPDQLGINDVGFVNQLVTTLKGEYSVVEERVYLCGFSNGSFLSQRIAFEGNEQFAAIGIIGGTMAEALFNTRTQERAVPMLYMLGTTDPLVPYDGGIVEGSNTDPIVGIDSALTYWVRRNECQTQLAEVRLPNPSTTDNSSVSVIEYTDCSCNNSQVKFYKITGGGHTWPGVPIPNQTLGAVNLDMQASEEIWEFFKNIERCD
ncbi:MAG TPA: hypothetical protein DCR93_04560 [Cytophagales bacterium]|nr:hypothetical protein [Cytophagales bacterium]